MQDLIQKIKNGSSLTSDEVEQVMDNIMSGKASHEQIREYLLALNAKGPTVEEITGAAKIMRKFVVDIPSKRKVILDTCGTGGDSKGTFNISTVTAFVVAGAGVCIAKHGNRSVSSRCGSADVLEALGVNLDVEQQHLSACLDEVGIAFLFAQKLHPAMKNVAPVRKDIGVKTVFNILGPLTNPAKATHQMMGVYSRDLVEPMAHVLKNLGLRRALVVHGSDGLDEITTTGKTFVAEWTGKEIAVYDIEPRELGFTRTRMEDLQAGDVEENMYAAREVLSGSPGPHRDIVVLNAAYALYTAEVVQNLDEGVLLAAASIDSGKAMEKLEKLKEFTTRAF